MNYKSQEEYDQAMSDNAQAEADNEAELEHQRAMDEWNVEMPTIKCDDKWLRFDEWKPKTKTRVICVMSKCSEDSLGIIKWHPAWRNYCFFPTIDYPTVHSDRCLLSISTFIMQLNDEHKKRTKKVV